MGIGLGGVLHFIGPNTLIKTKNTFNTMYMAPIIEQNMLLLQSAYVLRT
jgi:hypothetical protein